MDAQLYSLLSNGATVLTAGRHLAHRLRQDYAVAAQASGLSVWPTPRVLPWATYLHAACEQQRNRHGVTTSLRLLSELQSMALWERIVATSDSELLNPLQAARNAQRSWQLLHQYQIPLRQVMAYPGEEAQAFANWAQQFTDYTDQRQWLDSARFAGYLLEQDFQPDTALLLMGFAQQTPQMQALLQAWQQAGTEILKVQYSPRRGQASVFTAKHADEELRRAARWARWQVEAGKTQIAVVVPNLAAQAAQVQRRFTEVFAPGQRRIDQASQAAAFRVIATPTLSGYPLVHHALLLLQLLQERADILLVGQLLRSPFLAGYEVEAAPRALADIKARDERRERWSCNELERLATVNHCPQLAANMQAMANYYREQRSSTLPSQWTERFTQLLKLGGWAQVGKARVLDSTEQQTVGKFQRTLAQLSALDEVLGKISLSRALQLLRNACNDESFAPEALDQAVTIIDVDSVVGMQFDALWVMGLHAGDWPAAPEPDPFLPIELQRQYRLPQADAALRLQQARDTLQHLVDAADDIILSWPQTDDDAELRPSPLLNAWPEAALEQLPQSSTRTLGEQLFAERPTLEQLSDEHAPALTPGEATGGSRILELQSRCPFRAQAELRLYAQPVPAVSPAVEATERGQLIHGVLAEFWQQLKDSDGLKVWFEDGGLKPALQVTLQEKLREIAERVVQKVFPARTAHRQRLAALEVELCVQWIMSLLQVEAQRLPFRVHTTEQREPFAFAGLQLNIQLDRIDELSDGGRLLIDYKTGTANKPADWLDATPGRPRSPQLPLYALAHREQLAGISYAIMAPGTAEFRGLADTDSIAPGIIDYAQQKPGKKVFGVDSWDDLLQHWQALLSVLARQYLAGEAYVDPLKNECTYCHLRSLCRVHELLDGVSDEDGDE